MVIGLPTGIWMARSRAASTFVTPILVMVWAARTTRKAQRCGVRERSAAKQIAYARKDAESVQTGSSMGATGDDVRRRFAGAAPPTLRP
jgi:hypothetical protein